MTRCERCDRPRATAADWDHPGGCACERCASVCWSNVECEIIDWRARALAAEGQLCRLAATATEGAPTTRDAFGASVRPATDAKSAAAAYGSAASATRKPFTPNEELWAAVVKHCATWRGYLIEADNWGLMLASHGGHTVVVRQYMDRWTAGVRFTEPAEYITADEAVRAALRIVAPSTESNVSC